MELFSSHSSKDFFLWIWRQEERGGREREAYWVNHKATDTEAVRKYVPCVCVWIIHTCRSIMISLQFNDWKRVCVQLSYTNLVLNIHLLWTISCWLDQCICFICISIFNCISTVEIQDRTTTTYSSGLISLPATAPLIKQKQTVDSHLS